MSITKISPSVVDFDSEITITTADNTTQLTLLSTDADGSVGPRFDLKRDSADPEADDTLGQIRWLGKDSGGASLSYAHIATYIEDKTDGAEDGKFEIDVRTASANRSRLKMDSTETVFNEESIDVNFRVETNGVANMIFCNSTNDRVGIGTGDPSERLEVYSTQATTAIEVSAGQASTTTGEAKIVLRSLHSSSGTTYSRSEIASLGVAGGDSALIFRTTTDSNGPQERMRILDSGGLTFNGDTAAANAISDYEEGTYTVTGYDASSSGNASSTTITGTYTKIGRQVTIQFYAWNNINTSGMTSGNVFYFTLPFPASAIRSIGSAAHHGWSYDGNTNMQDIKPIVAGSTSRAYFKTVGYGQADSTVKVSDITSGTDDIHTLSITYFV